MDELKKLVEELNYHAYRYYVLDDPIISDKEYDALNDRLIELEAKTGIILPDSPTQKVGGKPLSKFSQHTHKTRLFSLDKVKNAKEFDEWLIRLYKNLENKAQKISFTVEHKFDGLTLNLTYDNGEYVRATTRGDGITGEDVTEQVKTIRTVPLKIPYKGLVEVQGEGVMRLSVFDKYNKTAETPLKNPRNAAAGAIRNLDPKITASRNLDVFFYSASCYEGALRTQDEVREFLRENRFNVGGYYLLSDNTDEIKRAFEDIDNSRKGLDYQIDGAVVKVNDFALRDDAGFTEKFPRWATAFKFEADEATAVVEGVEWNIGRTGKLTPLAKLSPVEIGGATVRNATLNNMWDIARKNVKINSRVFIRRSHDVIPEILGLAEEGENPIEIVKPVVCPSCGTKLIEKGPNLFCANVDACRTALQAKIVHFCSKDALDIEGISEKTIESLIDNLGISNPSDLYVLTREQLLTLDKFKEKKADKTLLAIENSKHCKLDRFIYALGINNIGTVAARELANRYKSIEGVKNASVEELSQIRDFGQITAQSVVDYFADKNNNTVIKKLLSVGVTPVYEQPKNTKEFFEGKRFVLTGTLDAFSRGRAKSLIEAAGGTVYGSVSADTDYLIVGADAGSKKDKAEKLGIKILNEDEFIQKIGEN